MRYIKSTVLIILISLLTITAHSQTTYTLSMKEASVVDIIDTLSQMIHCKFSFPTTILDNEKLIDISITEGDLNHVLNDIFTNFELEYSIANEQNILLREQNINVINNQSHNTSTDYISGKIISSESGRPVEFVAIAIPKHNLLAFSNDKGEFSLEVSNIPVEAKVKIHMLGYEITTLPLLQFAKKTDIILQEKPNEIEEITILGKTPNIIVLSDRTKITNKGLDNLGLGLAGNDAMRRVQMLPGIDASDDSSTDIKIRGSNADETLLILDGIPLYNTSHYYGIFSSLNSDYIQDVSVYKNAQPIQYGNKTAGVVEFKSNQNLTNQLQGKINLNLLESSITLSYPLTENSYFNISGRKTLRDISNTTFNSIGVQRNRNKVDENIQNYVDREDVISSEPNFNFWDLQAKYFMKPNKNNELQFSIFMSQDNFSNEIERESVIKRNSNSFLVSEETNNSEIWKTTGLGFNWNSQINKDLSIAVNSYISYYNIYNEIDFVTEFMDRDNDRDLGNRDDQLQFNSIKDIGLNTQLTKQTHNTDYHAGVNIVNHSTEFKLEFGEEDVIDQNLNSTEMTSYGEIIHRISDKLSVSSGIRTHYYTGTKSFYFSPQVSVSYTPLRELRIKSSISQTHQFLRELTIESNFGNAIDRWVLADGNIIPVSSSINSMLGLVIKKGDLTFDAELFYKKMNNVTELSLTSSRQFEAPRDMPERIFIGQGRSYGIDLLLSTRHKNFISQLAYTLSKVEHSFRAVNRGAYFSAANDRRHQLKLINEYSYKQFTFGLNYIFTSGRVFTDLSKLVNIPERDRGRINPNNFQSTLPHYHRFDISMNYKFDKSKFPFSIGIGIFNILDRQNIKYQQQIISMNTIPGSPSSNVVLGTNSDLLGRTLNLKFTVEF